MPRTMPQAPPPVSRTASASEVRESFRIRIVTPMFGGGVVPGVPDPVSIVRVPSIRGHLRFWWRMTRGALISDPGKLAEKEASIWGSTKEPSKVQAELKILSPGTMEDCADQIPGKSYVKFKPGYPGYALFPFQGNQREQKPIGSGCKGAEFELSLSFPKSLEKEITGALWAWCNFGGLGARTRRGAGALYCKEFAPSASSRERLAGWFHESSLSMAGTPFEETRLEKLLLLSQDQETARAWENVVNLMRNFRQKEPGRNRGNEMQPGRSLWPEPETIRRLTGKRMDRHARLPEIPDSGFPRAQFGLPIVFHFKDDKNGEPSDTNLVPIVEKVDTQRMASPLILKPLAISPDSAIPLVLRLKTVKPLEGVKLLRGGSPLAELPARKAVVSEEFSTYPRSPMGKPNGSNQPRSAKGSAVEAFLSFVRDEHGYWEV